MNENILLDKYRPASLSEVDHNHKVSSQLFQFCKTGSIPHMIIYGPQQSGKKTFIKLFLKEKYGNSTTNLRKCSMEILPNNTKINFDYFSSKYHFYIKMKDYNVYDRVIIQTLIKDISRTKNILCDYHIIVIDNAEKLNTDAQQSLLRTMEKHMNNCRFILLVDSEYSLIEPLTSRCMYLRLRQPSNYEISTILEKISKNENIKIKKEIIEKIPSICDNKISMSINFLEFLIFRNLLDKDVEKTYYEFDKTQKTIMELIDMVYKKDTINKFEDVNELLNDVLIYSTDPNAVMKKLFEKILKKSDKSKQTKLIFIADESYNNLTNHNKPIYHLMDYYVKCYECIHTTV